MSRPKGTTGTPKTGGRITGVSKNIATKDAKIALEDLAKNHAPAALAALVKVMETSDSPAAVVAAANGLLDRGYGKPRQGLELSGELKINQISEDELDARIVKLLGKA